MKGPDFLKTENWPFEPSTDVFNKINRNSLISTQIHLNPKNQGATTINANFASIASSFERQEYSSYEKLLRIVSYTLRLLLEFASNTTETESITDPARLEVAEQKFSQLVRNESFSIEKNFPEAST